MINEEEPEVKQVLSVWQDYLSTKDSLYQFNPYWASREYSKRNVPDYFYKRVNHSVFYNQKKFYKPTILSVEKEDSSYIIKTLFANGEKDNNFSRVSAIINVEVVKENGKWRLMSMLDRNIKNSFNQHKVDMINYYHPKRRNLDIPLCHKFALENTKIAQKFSVNPISVTYYLCENNKEVQRLKGFDFEISMAYPNQISGLADIFNNTIYAGNNSEWYSHELIHLYVNKIYGTNINEIFNEGIATYLGGSVDKPLEFHLRKVTKYVKLHPVNFNNLSSLDGIDGETNFQYSIGGLLCKIVEDKQGFEGVKKLLETGRSDEEFFQAIESIVKVKSIDFNKFIYEELEKYN
ncbi:hypothetical protein [Spirosoma utsteinense]|uniref:Peptidase MA-like domain-containing protein n=1 Tax=Spirosoma utsteinense TaxID=2585773 RepID=A0ABR6WEX1_9BACT|nr:hypothetical protein [Spirosoma utsteinense]MBC3794743.1 hypothetical protein [Spirosoma utsteinense]